MDLLSVSGSIFQPFDAGIRVTAPGHGVGPDLLSLSGSIFQPLDALAGNIAQAPRPLQLREAVYARLASSPTITALVGARIYIGALPQTINLKIGPALTYMVISRPYGHILTGSDGTSQARVQITAHAYQQATCDQIIQAVRDSFDGFVGSIGGLVITASIFDSEIDIPSPPFAGTDQWSYAIAADFQLNHRVSLPASLN
jgi:hypothetical protein